MAYQPLKQLVVKESSVPRRGARFVRFGSVGLVALMAIGALTTLYYSPAPPSELLEGLLGEQVSPVEQTTTLRQCASGLPLTASAPAPTNPWASLSMNETVQIHKWLMAPERGLNLTRASASELSDNIIFHIEAFRPPKAATIAYLDQGAPVPDRFARVSIHHGGTQEPYIADYLVGPLPPTEKSQIHSMDESHNRTKIPFNARGFVNMTEMSHVLGDMMVRLAPITKDLFGGVAMGHKNDTLVGTIVGPYSFNGSFRRGWAAWRHNAPGPWLHPINFFQYVDLSGTDKSKWKILKVVYNHQVFNSVDAFVTAYEGGTLKRMPKRPDQDPSKADYSWSTRRRRKSAAKLDLDHLPGPRSVSFAGIRFRVDTASQFVSWMGWQMYLSFERDMGMSLWDIRLHGERIIYELSPQEALAQYAGNDPMQTTTAWLDSFFGMGSAVRDLIPGYDCPHEAVFLPAITYTTTAYMERNYAICIFESDTGRPITRHTGYSESEFGATKGYTLTIRSISTVGNYDYLFDYIFQIDGTIEVRVSASGYLQGAFWEDKQEGYGTAIRETTMGSLHDHVVNFKVDLDVGGLSNSLLRTWTEREEVTQPWFDDDWGNTVIQQKIHKEFVKTEDGGRLKYPPNFQGGYALVNTEAKNQWGSPRGYAIHPGYNPIHTTVVGSKRMLKNANWAKYNLAVSVRKDKEFSSSNMWNANLPGNPLVNFDDFFDGENMTQADLVAWVNVGTHHLVKPQAEDAPNTRTNLATSSFFLTPLNYFDYDVSIDSMNAILVHHPKEPGAPFTFEDYGVSPVHSAPPPVAPFSYLGIRAYGHDGELIAVPEMDDLRKQAELFHRIKIEL